MKKAIVVGASGLVGKKLTKKLLVSSSYHSVTVLVRKPFEINHPKLTTILVDFNHLNSNLIVADDVFCCLGTTMKQARSKESFYKVDYIYPFEIAKAAKENGASQFLLISSIGANKKSRVFYSRVKGEIENAISTLGYKTFLIFRPSLLGGKRTSENRLGERISSLFIQVFSLLIPKKYRILDSNIVAEAMIDTAQKNYLGKNIFESDFLQDFYK